MANRLAAETSPYLQQHAANPVDWYAWGPEALERLGSPRVPVDRVSRVLLQIRRGLGGESIGHYSLALRRSAHGARKWEDLGEAEDVRQEQDQEHEHHRSDEVAAGGQAVDAGGKRRRLVVVHGRDASLD